MLKYSGYAGKILVVDLSSGRVTTKGLDARPIHKYIGGFGFNHFLAWDYLSPTTKPLSSANPIIIGTGALAGTVAPSTTKVMVTTKLPINGAVGTPFGSGFAQDLKLSGYDALIITGRREIPVYRKIGDAEVKLCDAHGIWGRDIYQTTDLLWKRHGGESGVIAIGPAGENLVPYSFALINKISTLGRGGLGAVMGKKRLKAIVVWGTVGVQIANPKGFMKAVNTVRENMRKLPYRDAWEKFGPGVTRIYGDFSAFGTPIPDKSTIQRLERIHKCIACPTCILGEKSVVTLPDGEFAGLSTYKSYSTDADNVWSNIFNVGSYDRGVKCRDLTNRYGIDDYTASTIMKIAVELFQGGSISKSDCDGLTLKMDFETAIQLIEKINRREGLGLLLAEGIQGLRNHFPQAMEGCCSTIKGLEPMYDPRLLFTGMAISQVVNPRGSYIVAGNSPAYLPNRKIEQFRRYLKKLGVKEDHIGKICKTKSKINMGRLTKYSEDWYAALSCLGVCFRQPVTQCYTPELAAELYSQATGFELTGPELMKVGERAWNMLKILNVREGFSRKDDTFPEEFFLPLEKEGKTLYLRDYYGNKMNREDIMSLFDDYYEERGWDIKEGIPTQKKLVELGIEDLM